MPSSILSKWVELGQRLQMEEEETVRGREACLKD